VLLLGAILAPIAATIIQLAVSRDREYGADRSGAALTHDPEGLASALERLDAVSQQLRASRGGMFGRRRRQEPVPAAMAHLYTVNPLGGSAGSLFSTHPPSPSASGGCAASGLCDPGRSAANPNPVPRPRAPPRCRAPSRPSNPSRPMPGTLIGSPLPGALTTTVMDLIFWVVFLTAIGIFLALDLGVFHRDAHVVSTREALGWTALWVSLAVAFGIGVFAWQGSTVGIQWFTGYVVEYSLSVDNVFVFALVFGAFAVPRELQHRVLFWGVLGALMMRLVLILVGAHLIESYHWIIYVFGAFLVFTGLRMAFGGGEEASHPEKNPIVRFAARHMRVLPHFEGQRFLVPTAAGIEIGRASCRERV